MPEETPTVVDESQTQDITLEENYNNQALVLQKQVGELQVVDEITFNTMSSIETTAKDNVKALTAHMAGPIADAHSKHKKLTKLRNDLVSPHTEVAKAARRKCIVYAEEQKRIVAEEARKQAEILHKQEEDARLKVAAELEAEGKDKQATQVLEAPAMPAPAVPVIEAVHVKGARKVTSAEIYDVPLLFKSLSERPPVLDEGQLADLIRVMKFNDLARSMGANTEKMLPGLRAVTRIV